MSKEQSGDSQTTSITNVAAFVDGWLAQELNDWDRQSKDEIRRSLIGLRRAIADHIVLPRLDGVIERLRAANLPTFDLLYNPLTCEKVDGYKVARYEDVVAFLARRADELETILPTDCPSCESPYPQLHQAMRWDGEASRCRDPWHDKSKITSQAQHTELLAALASLVARMRQRNYDAALYWADELAALLKDPAATTDDDQARSRPAMDPGAGDLAPTSPTSPPSSSPPLTYGELDALPETQGPVCYTAPDGTTEPLGAIDHRGRRWLVGWAGGVRYKKWAG